MITPGGARRGGAIVVGLLLAGVVLAACGSSPPGATRTTTSSPGPHRLGRGRSSTTTTTTTPTTSSTSPSATTTSSSVPATAALACSSGLLSLHEGGVAAAAGTSHLTFLLVGEGPRPCTLRGYPSVVVFGASGAGGAGAGTSLGIRAIELGPAPQTVTVSTGHPAAFVLSVAEVPVNGAGCRQAASLQVTPPGGAGALSIPASFPVCGGTVGVYPVTTAP